jgi:hypothetical protein
MIFFYKLVFTHLSQQVKGIERIVILFGSVGVVGVYKRQSEQGMGWKGTGTFVFTGHSINNNNNNNK